MSAIVRQEILEGALAPRDYIVLPPISDDWRVLEIGPGRYPWMRADVFLDHDKHMLESLRDQGKETILGDLESGLHNIPDGAFDFCFISHVLEHCEHLKKCITTLNRIAKAGMAVMPSFAKEALFFFEEDDHKWLVFPNPRNPHKACVFVRTNEIFRGRLAKPDLQRAMCYLFRTGHHCSQENELKEWFATNERDLDVVVEWNEVHPLAITVIE